MYSIWGTFSNARILARCGLLADSETGLRSWLEEQYLNLTRTKWDNAGQIIQGEGWPWNTLYAYISQETPAEAQIYWGNSRTGPAIE